MSIAASLIESLLQNVDSNICNMIEEVIQQNTTSTQQPLNGGVRSIISNSVSYPVVYETYITDTYFNINVDVPGVAKEDIDISISEVGPMNEKNTLVISVDRKKTFDSTSTSTSTSTVMIDSHIQYGKRVVNIPIKRAVLIDDIQAKLVDGILRVQIPIPSSTKKDFNSRRILIS